MKKAIALVVLLAAPGGQGAYASSLHGNASVGLFAIIPTASAGLQIGDLGNAVRLNYAASIANPLSGKRYQALLLEYSFYASKYTDYGDDWFVSAGKSKTTGGSEPERDYDVLGVGWDRVLERNGLFGSLGRYMYGRLYVNFYRQNLRAGQTGRQYDVVGGLELGIELF